MKPERGLVIQSFRTANIFNNDGLGKTIEVFLFLLGQIFSGVDDNGQLLMLGSDLLDEFESGHVGQHQIDYRAQEFVLAKLDQSLCRTRCLDNVDGRVCHNFANGSALGRVGFNHD